MSEQRSEVWIDKARIGEIRRRVVRGSDRFTVLTRNVVFERRDVPPIGGSFVPAGEVYVVRLLAREQDGAGRPVLRVLEYAVRLVDEAATRLAAEHVEIARALGQSVSLVVDGAVIEEYEPYQGKELRA